MTREEHLKLCEHCKNRNMQLSRDIFCNLYGDIPDFETQCEKYEFSEKVKKRSDNKEVNRTKLISLIGFILALIIGFARITKINQSTTMTVIMGVFLVIAISWIMIAIIRYKS